MTLPALLAHVAARWAVAHAPAHGWVPDESEIEMSEQTYTLEDMARAWVKGREAGTIATMLKLSYGVAHEPFSPYEEEDA